MKESKEDQNLPLISVGIPTYNRPEGLRRILTEITRQTYPNLDVIVSDNASTSDETRMVVGEFMREDMRVRYFRQVENQGPAINFQFVLDQARGEYFMWAADDDWHKANFIEELYKQLSGDSSAVVAFCDFDSRNEGGASVPGFPKFLDALKLMCESSAFLRQINFFLLKEGTAKPHPIYGLIRRDVLAGFSWTGFIDKCGGNAADSLFVFWLMTKGRLALSEKRLFGCTVGNKKDYIDKNKKWNLPIYLTFVGQQIKYLYGYIRITQGVTKLVLILLFPWKLLGIVHLFAINPGFNLIKRRLGRLKERRG